MPARIQRKRTRGWEAPRDDQGRKPVYVGRGTRWGNPYTIQYLHGGHNVMSPDGGIIFATSDPTDARRVAVDWYRAWFSSQPDLLAAARRELAGRDLMCWCPPPESGDPDHCHAAVLLEAVSREAEGASR